MFEISRTGPCLKIYLRFHFMTLAPLDPKKLAKEPFVWQLLFERKRQNVFQLAPECKRAGQHGDRESFRNGSREALPASITSIRYQHKGPFEYSRGRNPGP